MGSYTLIATFALLVGAAVASIGFKEGHEYEYKYVGKAVSGIPNLKNQFAGVVLRGDVRFQRISQQTVLMTIERMEAIELNGPVPTGPTEKVLQDLQREAPQTIQQTVDLCQIAPALRHTVRIQYENGKIRSFEVSRDCPEWALNIKKGVMSMIKLKLDESLAYGKAEQMNKVSKQYNEDIFLNYNVMEEDTNGMCLSTYAISSQPWEAKPDRDVLNVTKFRNYNKCDQFQQFSLKTLQDEKCPNCKANNPEVYSDVAVMKFNLRGNRHAFEIEKVETQDQFIYAPYTTNADYYLTNTSRTLVLRHKQPIQQQLGHQCSNCKVLTSLQYKLVSRQHLQGQNQYVNGQFDLHKAPITPFNAHWTQEQQRQQQHVKIEELVAIIRQIAQEMRNVEQEQKPEILSKTLQAKKLMRMLNFQQIEQVYQETKRADNKIAHRVCQDIMVMAGTAPSLLVITKAIQNEEIRGEEAALLIQQIPTTIMTPHYTLIKQIKQLTRCSAAQKDSQVYTTVWLTYGSLISVACNGTGNTRETPSFVPKNFYCPTEVKQQLIQEIGQELHQTRDHWRKTVLIHALGNTKAPEAAKALLPLISAQTTDCPVLRSKAIHALNGAAKVRPNLVLKVLAPVFFNVDEVAEVRAAALSVMISCHPKNQFLSKIAASTWTEPSKQVGSFVYSTLKSLSDADMPCLKDLKKDALMALELANPDFDGSLIDSQNMIFDDDKMDVFNMFNTLQTYWIRSNESIIPTEIMAKLNTTFAGYNFNQFSSQLHLKGVDEVLNRMFGPKSAFYQMRNTADLFKNEKAESRKGFRQLVEALQIDTEERQTSDFLLNFYVKMYDTQARNFHITKQAVRNFVTGNVHNDLAKQFHQLVFGNGLQLNHHKLFNAHERLVQFPTPLGLPVVITVDSPVYVGVQGHMNVEIDSSRNPNSVVPTNVRLSANIRPVVIMKKLTTVGLVLPYENKHAAVVVSRKTILSVPINGQINVNLPEAKITVVAGRSQHQRMHQEGQQLPNAHYECKPFTVIHRYTTALPYFRQQTVKPIQTLHRPRQYEEVKMTRTLGLPIVIKGRHEHEMTTVNSLIEKIQEDGVWNSVNYIWLHPQTFKYSEHTVRAQVNQAETKEVKAVLDFDFTNSKLQRNVRDGQYTPNQIWSLLAGWSNLPMPCKPANELNANAYDSEFEQYNNEYNGQYNSEYDNQDDLEQGQFSSGRKGLGFSSLMKRFGFWKNWEGQRDTRFESDSDDLEGQGNWFNNYRQSRRYPFSSSNAAINSGRYTNDEYNWATNYNEQGNAQIQRTNIAEHVPAWKLYCKVQAIGGQQRSIVAIFTGKRNFAQLADSVVAEIKVQNPRIHGNQISICAEAVAQYPSVPCSYDHSFNPAAIAPIHVQAKATWGHQGCSAENHVNVVAKIGKSGKQLRFEQEAKPWYFKQCMNERQKGLKFNEACSKLYDQVTALNKIELVARYNNVPAMLKNATYKLDDLIKAAGYKKMSNNALTGRNEHNQIRIVAEFQPNKDAVDVKIEKPTETTIFKELETTLEPLSAHRTVAQQVADAITGRQLPATCDISGGKYINTFNNLTYKHEMGQCTYLAARDCSPNGLFAVLVSGPQAQKSSAANGIYCEVQLLKNTIKLAPLTPRMDAYKVSVNGQTQQLTQGETIVVESGYQAPGTPEPLCYITLTGHFVHVKAPAHGIEIKYDGKDVRVETSYFYSGKLCGLCGNFDGETKNEFEGPHGCMYGKARDFAESYIISNGECQQRAHQARMTCAKNNQETTAVYPQLKSIQAALHVTDRNVDESSDFANRNIDSAFVSSDYSARNFNDESYSGRNYNEESFGSYYGNGYSANTDYETGCDMDDVQCQQQQQLEQMNEYSSDSSSSLIPFYARRHGGMSSAAYMNGQQRNIKVQKNFDSDSDYVSGRRGANYRFGGKACFGGMCLDNEQDDESCLGGNCGQDVEQQLCYGENCENKRYNNYGSDEDKTLCYGENCETKVRGGYKNYGSDDDDETQCYGGDCEGQMRGSSYGYDNEDNENIFARGMLSRNMRRGLNKECYGQDCQDSDSDCIGQDCEYSQYSNQYQSGIMGGNYEDDECYGQDCLNTYGNRHSYRHQLNGDDQDECLGQNCNQYLDSTSDLDQDDQQCLGGICQIGDYNDEDECYGSSCLYRNLAKQCDSDDVQCLKHKLFKHQQKQSIFGEDEDEEESNCQCDDDDQTCDCGSSVYGRVGGYQNKRDSSYCTVYRNKISYGGKAQHSGSGWFNIYNRLYSSAKYQQDSSDYFTSNSDNQICFSINPHKQCKAECQPKHEQLRTVRYHCMDAESYEAKQLLRQQPYERLSQLQDKTVHLTKQEYIPTYCQAY